MGFALYQHILLFKMSTFSETGCWDENEARKKLRKLYEDLALPPGRLSGDHPATLTNDLHSSLLHACLGLLDYYNIKRVLVSVIINFRE